MAKVIITIEDGSQGELKTAIEFDPPGKKGFTPTEAQKIGNFIYEDVIPDLLAPEEEPAKEGNE